MFIDRSLLVGWGGGGVDIIVEGNGWGGVI